MANRSDPDLEQRMQQLIREVGTPAAAPQARSSGRGRSMGKVLPRVSLVAGVSMALALLIGIQLGALPWRYRRELWRAQGVVIGVVVGIGIGRLTVRRPEED